ncbi:hypothetical protein M758_5G185600 [Ceratodon purpureus]|uniref:Uncharacterized protein n=1 Tax=Ceratodon purpureus TaxID=3225 RepID=A0A8T0I396_CERPU|nr:hypothetical protein KC19_5G192800 [Ceratodon purpureus]KAG0617379.1 hypothetical protein M758_5G185600 [Ceratodon purpureus]
MTRPVNHSRSGYSSSKTLTLAEQSYERTALFTYNVVSLQKPPRLAFLLITPAVTHRNVKHSRRAIQVMHEQRLSASTSPATSSFPTPKPPSHLRSSPPSSKSLPPRLEITSTAAHPIQNHSRRATKSKNRSAFSSLRFRSAIASTRVVRSAVQDNRQNEEEYYWRHSSAVATHGSSGNARAT